MTREEAKTAERGTPVLVRGRFLLADKDGDALVTFANSFSEGNAFVSLSAVELAPEARKPDSRLHCVEECTFTAAFYVLANGMTRLTIPYGADNCLYRTREQALTAAYAERDRLNAENGKEEA